MPSTIRDKIANNFDAYYESSSQNYVFDCDKATSLEVEVMGHKIEVPTTAITKKVKGSDKCILQNINVGSDDNTVTFGWVFFPYIYGVFDAENKELLFGEPNTDTSDSDIKDVSDSIPGSTQAASYSSVSDAITTNSISTSSIETSSSSLDIDSIGVSSGGSCSVTKAISYDFGSPTITPFAKRATSVASTSNGTNNLSSTASISLYQDSASTYRASHVLLFLASVIALFI